MRKMRVHKTNVIVHTCIAAEKQKHVFLILSDIQIMMPMLHKTFVHKIRNTKNMY